MAKSNVSMAETLFDEGVERERVLVLSRLVLVTDDRRRFLDWCDYLVAYHDGATASRTLSRVLAEAPEDLRPRLSDRLRGLRGMEGHPVHKLSWLHRLLLDERPVPGDKEEARARLVRTYVKATVRTYLGRAAEARSGTVAVALAGAIGGALLNGAGGQLHEALNPPQPRVVSRFESTAVSLAGDTAAELVADMWISRFVHESYTPLIAETCRDALLRRDTLSIPCLESWRSATRVVKHANDEETKRIDLLVGRLSRCAAGACEGDLDPRDTFDGADYRIRTIEPDLNSSAIAPGAAIVEKARWEEARTRAQDYRILIGHVGQLLGELHRVLGTPIPHCGLSITLQNTGAKPLNLPPEDWSLVAGSKVVRKLRRLRPDAAALTAVPPQGVVTIDFLYDDFASDVGAKVELGGALPSPIAFNEPVVAHRCAYDPGPATAPGL